MGGGLASYAALRNKVPAVVMNPMRLGWGARARIGQSRLDEADRYLTEVVAQGDCVSDSDLSKLYMPLAPVFNSRGPLGNARRFMVPAYGTSSAYRHNTLGDLAGQMVTHHEVLRQRAPTLLTHLQQTSPRARGHMMAGRLRPAISEAIPQGAPGLRMTSYQRRYIAGLVATLISGRGRDNEALDGEEIAGLRGILGRQLEAVRQANPDKPVPQVLQAIAADFVTDVPRAARQAFAARDKKALQRFEDFTRVYQPGGQKFEAIMAKFNLPKGELPEKLLQQHIARRFMAVFGKYGENMSSNDAANEVEAGKVVVSVVDRMLRDQINLTMAEDPELGALIDKASLWARQGVPEGVASQ
jgi:hypothetical protein